jgi:hypothetical protein
MIYDSLLRRAFEAAYTFGLASIEVTDLLHTGDHKFKSDISLNQDFPYQLVVT